MIKINTIMAFAFIFITAFSSFAQEFEVIPDSTEGIGRMNEMNLFDSYIRNLWDQHNDIKWEIVKDIPDGWMVEICQLSRICWSPFVVSDTIKLAPDQEDSLQVKFYAYENEGTGRVDITLTSYADTSIHQEFTFLLHAGAVDVKDTRRNRSGPPEVNILDFYPTHTSGSDYTAKIYSPISARAEIKAYNILGQLSANLWKGQLIAGENTITPVVNLPAGIYIVRLELDNGEHAVRKMLISR